MIKSVQIENFRGIREGKLGDLTPLVVLVGPNGCGKSTVLDALLIGANRNSKQAATEVVKRHEHDKGDSSKDWLFWRGPQTTEATMLVDFFDQPYVATTMKSDEGFTLTSWRNNIDLVPDLCSSSFRSLPETRVQIPPRELQTLPEIDLVEHFKGGLPLDELFSRAVKMGQRQQVKALLAEVVPGLVDLSILVENGKSVTFFEYADHAVPVSLSGDGIYHLVRLALNLTSRDKAVMLVEEPEAHLHPAAICQSVRAILAAIRRDIQVILTTHSLEFIDFLLSEAAEDDLEKTSLYRLSLAEGLLKSRRMTGEEISFARTEIESDLR